MSEHSPANAIYLPVKKRRSQTLSVRGVEYCLHEWGNEDAPLIVFLHGFADAGSTFQFVVDALQHDWRVVAPDWRGFGRTAHVGESYWFPDYLADLHQILNHYSPREAVNLVGHSMGGNVASLYAGILPDRVRALVNLEGFGLADADPGEAPGRYRRWLSAMALGSDFSCYSSFDELAGRILHRNPGIGADRAAFVAREWGAERDGEIRLRADPRHKLPNPVLYRRREAEACWRAITARVLLVSGSNSAFAHGSGERVTLPLAAAAACSIPDVGHMLHFEAPERVALAVEEFLKKTL